MLQITPAIIITVHRHHDLPTPLIPICRPRVPIWCTRKRFKWYKMHLQTAFVPFKTFSWYKIPRGHLKMAAHNVHVTAGEFKDNMLPLSNWKTHTT